ncbi:hypothetical protein [Mycolicibacterium sp.]|uniref:hypothetical protein n=1 Tax=Mycolicibacterium sp. TaxID=2320850 RepID=UPI00355E15F2
MAVGTGSETLQNIPNVNFVVDPPAFFAQTSKNVATPKSRSTPDPGGFFTEALPQAGVVSKILLHFVGEITVVTAAATSSARWPYGLLDAFQLSANGQNDLVQCDGLDLHALRFVRYPSYDESVDAFPGTVGGGDTVATGSHDLHLTWEIPIAMDDTTLVGSLYAQSAATNLQVRAAVATMAQMFSANPGNVTLSGQWYITTTFFDIPVDGDGRIIIPDLSQLHGINAVDYPFTSVGEVRTPLIRSAGTLMRLLVSAQRAANNPLSALPAATSANKITDLRLEYGGNRRPYVFSPSSTLLAINNQHYGAPVPYDRMVLDFVRENPLRDRVLMQGVTELAAVPTIGSGVSVTDGRVRLVQETLF